MRKQYNTIDEYIKDSPPEARTILEKIRETIKKTASNAVETISYQMPAFKLNGKPLVYFAAFKNHIGFYPTPSGMGSFEAKLSSYKSGRGTAQFSLDKPIPYDLIEKIVRFRVRENSVESDSKRRG